MVRFLKYFLPISFIGLILDLIFNVNIFIYIGMFIGAFLGTGKSKKI
jgi:hypothetical protein